jgi:thiol-disulfide isomerase/thioredoxin
MCNFAEMENVSKLAIVIFGGFILYQLISYLSQGTVPAAVSMKGGQRRRKTDAKRGGGSGPHRLYLFYTPWCHFCTKIRCGPDASKDDRPSGRPNPQSAWGKVFYECKKNTGLRVKPIEVNADENRSLASRYNVDAYPTIVLVKSDNSHKEYTGENEASGILKFLRQETQ